MTAKRIALTPGEPAGIGPDITVELAQQALAVQLVAVADPQVLQQRAQQLGLPLTLREFDASAETAATTPGCLDVVPVAAHSPVIAGQLNPDNGPYVLACLQTAVQLCRDGTCDALVTGPVHKGNINDAGIEFTGHTEYLAELTATAMPVMMLVAGNLRVALVTTHLALADVSAAITRDRLQQVLRVLHRDLQQRFQIENPAILVCGLNPHAGEQGHLGREEIDVIAPVLEQCRDEGMQLLGPLPADTLFTPRYLDRTHAVLAMYHDQGLPVLKFAGFGQAVNITLGLPIVRTSVDHGTALELAGTGQAEVSSLLAAVQMADQLVAGHD